MVTESDPELGWSHRPGRFEHPAVTPRASPFRLTLLPDGSRDTGWRGRPPDAPSVWVIGGSFTQGWGVSDHETFVWRLQEARPRMRFVNLAVPAYGTVQALAGLQRRLRENRPPAVVVYGFIEDHGRRNVGTPGWVRDIGLSRPDQEVRFPVCRPGPRGPLDCGLSEAFRPWGLSAHLAGVALLDALRLEWSVPGRPEQAVPATQALLLDLARTVRDAGGRLLVALLQGRRPALDHYAGFLERHGTAVADCALPLRPGYHLPGDLHPSPLAHARYASCIGTHLDALLAGAGS